jgi:hypothetical protein
LTTPRKKPAAPRRPNQNRRYWLTHGFYRTYAIADRIAAIASSPISYVRELEGLTVDEGILDFLPNWQKESVLHKFAHWVADEMFVEDTSGPYLQDYDENNNPVRYLPVDIALNAYGICLDEPFKIPPPHGQVVQVSHNVTRWEESHEVADACYEYFMEDLRLSQPYAELLEQIADEVFHTMFHNRVALAGLNAYLSWHVDDLDPEGLDDHPEIAKQFRTVGKLKRTAPPRWARRAVFFRDHGRCAWCGTDLSGLIDALPSSQFDHIIPLAAGGLNDVTNLQLLCQPCNGQKSAKTGRRPSSKYRRLYDAPSRRSR